MLLRQASLHESRGDYEAAIAGYDRAIEVGPRNWQLYLLRGSARFKAGRIDGSIEDFDRSWSRSIRPRTHTCGSGASRITTLVASPSAGGSSSGTGWSIRTTLRMPSGILLCVAAEEGLEAAREAMLPVGPDARRPMKEIDALFRGRRLGRGGRSRGGGGKSRRALLRRSLPWALLRADRRTGEGSNRDRARRVATQPRLHGRGGAGAQATASLDRVAQRGSVCQRNMYTFGASSDRGYGSRDRHSAAARSFRKAGFTEAQAEAVQMMRSAVEGDLGFRVESQAVRTEFQAVARRSSPCGRTSTGSCRIMAAGIVGMTVALIKLLP